MNARWLTLAAASRSSMPFRVCARALISSREGGTVSRSSSGLTGGATEPEVVMPDA